ncbi:MAG: isoprenylcysteine carboxylmethyltransferase family protein [Rhodospirillales bacterium]|nr:isoprenylcysteine carboxylmethyltransferase family protein [Rhodospirillales bacterium]
MADDMDTYPDKQMDRAQVVIRPPLLWFSLICVGYGLDWLIPAGFMPSNLPNIWVGGGVFALGLVLALWSFRQFREFRTDVDTHSPTSDLVDTGPFGFSRNPIYCGMFLGIVGIAIGLNTLWIIAGLVIWYPVMRYGVIGREGAYLERLFGADYIAYKSCTRRWI